MAKTIEVGGVATVIKQANFGQGGQGQVHLVHLKSDPDKKMALKELRGSTRALARTKYLCQRNLSALSPAFAGPIVCEDVGNGRILHLAPFAEGGDLDDYPPRALPQNLEICLEFVSLIQLLEENGIVHGDLGTGNIRIAPDGTVTLIDFDGYLADDPTIPPPDTIGQFPMLAPEQRDGTHEQPTRESGYFAMAVFMSTVATGRYPTEGLADEPTDVVHYMSQGHWPEHDRISDVDDLPIAALGQELVDLFDLAFSLNPQARPSPDVWRRALVRALQNCWVHDCGQCFVAASSMQACPGCGAQITIPGTRGQLKIQLLPTGPRYGLELKDRVAIVLGRSTIPGLPPTVSSRHLEILPFGGKFLLRHVGRNPTLIRQRGQWYRLQESWLDADDLNSGIDLQLADLMLSLISG
ncbi:hypothetical protein EGN72_01055 [Pseudorhodobacter sp. E13]|uniref:protein kinase n=1 Tax=Pseudorhodobacter sp. E13 TaxID=2487931 RepID=UPI000F8E5BBD|nr:protein kinase [Pseudorhodobacter sp. E13]RUS65179.1 hypothetical protein EGN72_01055 [Pseudorhodobacter sp. E13]